MIFNHPFRDNQYYFTEITPFPNIDFPLFIDKSWSATLNIGSGWGIWDNVSLKTSYQVTDQESIFINDMKYIDCWKIVSSASFDLGVSYLTMWFHEESGFVKLNYVTYAGQVLQLELDKVINH